MSSAPHLLESRPLSVAHIFLSRIRATPDGEAYRYPVAAAHGAPGTEEWRSMTWAGAGERVKAIAGGLLALGLGPEERVAISSSTRVEWILADLGVMCAGAAATAVYPSTNADETAYILADSGSRAIFVENAEQLAKVAAHTERLPGLDHAILFDAAGDIPEITGVDVLTLAELEKRGTAHLAEHPDAIETTVAAVRPDQLATLIYTSGTTGRPKGVRLVHDCWSYQGVVQEVTGLVRPDDVQFLWLPLSHVFGKALISGQLTTGHVVAVDGRIDRIVTNLPAVRPTVMASAPRIFEKVYNGIAARARAEGGVRYKIFLWAAKVARDYARTGQEQRVATGTSRIPLGLAVQHAIADKLVYGKIRAAFGGALRGSASGSAALAPEIGYFFAGAGVPVLEGYGLTETSAACTVSPPDDYRVGTVGRPLPGTEVRVAEDGELLLRGPGVMRGSQPARADRRGAGERRLVPHRRHR